MAREGQIPRPEYPRPQWQRRDWLCLNGTWEFGFDEGGEICVDKILGDGKLPQEITVPFCFESRLSGVGDTTYHDRVWYARDLKVPEAWPLDRVVLHFGAVDYAATVWVNGREVGRHRGGHVPFELDIAPYLDGRRARIVLRVEDSPSIYQPRGKQFWRSKSAGCHYTRTTGIWQSVWLEPVPASSIRSARYYPDIESGVLNMAFILDGARPGQKLSVDASLGGQKVSHASAEVGLGSVQLALPLPDCRLWSPESPTLYDLDVTLRQGRSVVDRVSSYAGMRKVSVESGKWCLNGSPCFQRLILDQGYWPDGIMTAPTDDALKKDIELSLAFGFNGARKHQKIEDPRWLYWADRLGYLVWGEMANARDWHPDWEEACADEWLASVERDFNHPSIVTWTPFNESWGVLRIGIDPRVSAFAEGVVAQTRMADPTRTINDNCGWEHTGSTDILSIHDYDKDGGQIVERWKGFRGRAGEALSPAYKSAFVKGVEYGGQPFMLTEYGGIAYVKGKAAEDGWGYHGVEPDEAAFMARFEAVHKALRAIKTLQGFCYTQLTDVEQEINGLTDFDRNVKVAPERIAKILKGGKR